MGTYKQTDTCIKDLISNGLLACKNDPYPHLSILSITPDGLGLLEKIEIQAAKEEQRRTEKECAESKRLEERLEDHTREEHYHQTQNKVSIAAAIIGPIVSFLLGMITEHYTGIISFFASLHH